MGRAKAVKTVDKGRFSRLLQKQAVGGAPTSVAKKRELPKTMEALQNIGLRGSGELKANLAVAARSEGTRNQHNRVLKDLKDYMATHGVSPMSIDDDIIIGFLLKSYADEKSFSYIRLVSIIVSRITLVFSKRIKQLFISIQPRIQCFQYYLHNSQKPI